MSTIPFELILSMVRVSQLPLLYVWGLTCKETRKVAAQELRFRHTRILRRFFPDVTRFLNTLGFFNAVVAGSLALAYFDGWAAWSPQNCDIYVPFLQYQAFVWTMQEIEGYELVDEMAYWQKKRNILHGPQTDAKILLTTGIHSVTILVHPLHGLQLHVIQVKSHFALYALPRSWTTATMNFISSTGFCSLYPVWTSQRKAFLNITALEVEKDQTPLFSDIIPEQQKYINRGYTHLPPHNSCIAPDDEGHRAFKHNWHKTHSCGEYLKWSEDIVTGPYPNMTGHAVCPQRVRRLFDSGCFALSFPPHDSKPPAEGLDHVFACPETNPTPDENWTMTWRLGSYQEPLERVTAGWTKTTLLDAEFDPEEYNPIAERLSLHCLHHRDFYDEEYAEGQDEDIEYGPGSELILACNQENEDLEVV